MSCTFLGAFSLKSFCRCHFFLPSSVSVNPKQTWLLVGMEKIPFYFVFLFKWKVNVASAALKRGEGLTKSEKLSSSKVLN